MIEMDALQKELGHLPKEERLALAHWLLGTIVEPIDLREKNSATDKDKHPLMRWAGIFSGGPGDTAERDEEILEAEIDKISGWSHS